MLRPEIQATPVATLGLGRGKIRTGWTTAEAVGELMRLADPLPYSAGPQVVGLLPPAAPDRGHDVEIDRVKLPPPGLAATVDLASLLVDPDTRAAYLDPRTLEAPPRPTPPQAGSPAAAPLEGDPEVAPSPAAPPPAGPLVAPHSEPCDANPWPDADGSPPPAALPGAGPLAAELPTAPRAVPERAPFTGRVCNRVRPAEFGRFVRALDEAGMLVVVRESLGPRAGFFCVRKEWSEERQLWLLRLILDRRPRNAEERQIALDERTPHGSLLCEVLLGEHEELRVWASDLPQFYYRMMVSAERAASNSFRAVEDGDEFRHLSAVQRLLEAEGRTPDEPVGRIVFCLGTMAMGDVNATAFAQAGHLELVRQHGGVPADTVLGYRLLFPRGPVFQGLYIDDQATVACVPRGPRWRLSPAARRAEELFAAARRAYEVAGVEDVEEKRKVAQLTATVWGCESQGRRGKAGAPRAKRAALSALTFEIAVQGCATVLLLATVLGMWADALLYRRAAFAVLRAAYRHVVAFSDDPDGVVRALPGPVQTELLGLVALAPVLETALRNPVDPVLKVSDASLLGAAVVQAPLPEAAAQELWRRRLRPGRPAVAVNAPGNRRGDSFVGEMCEGIPMKRRLEMRWSRRGHPGHINVAEARSRRALWRSIAGRVSEHRRRHLVVYDSAVVVGAASRGRASSGAKGLSRELRLTYPHILACDAEEGCLWCESEANLADHGSRGRALPVPAPRRPWVHAFFSGDNAALERRLAEAEAAPRGHADWRADHAPAPAATDGEAENPGPPRRVPRVAPADRAGLDLRVRALGAGDRPARLGRLLDDLEAWLARERRPVLAALAEPGKHPAALDAALADYGQHMWATDGSQHAFAETLNAVRHAHPHVRGSLGGAWSVRSAWGHLEPGSNRTPVSPVLARALVALALVWEWPMVAALIALAFECALRPGDVLGLQRQDLRFRAEHGEDHDALYVVLRHSKTAQTRGARWQHVRCDEPAVVALLFSVFGRWPADALLFPHAGQSQARARKLAAYFEALCRGLDVPYGAASGFTLAGLRAGGITALYQACRDLELVRWKGRWDSARTLEHYIQELPMSRAYAELPVQTRARLKALGRLVGYLVRVRGLNVTPAG